MHRYTKGQAVVHPARPKTGPFVDDASDRSSTTGWSFLKSLGNGVSPIAYSSGGLLQEVWPTSRATAAPSSSSSVHASGSNSLSPAPYDPAVLANAANDHAASHTGTVGEMVDYAACIHSSTAGHGHPAGSQIDPTSGYVPGPDVEAIPQTFDTISSDPLEELFAMFTDSGAPLCFSPSLSSGQGVNIDQDLNLDCLLRSFWETSRDPGSQPPTTLYHTGPSDPAHEAHVQDAPPRRDSMINSEGPPARTRNGLADATRTTTITTNSSPHALSVMAETHDHLNRALELDLASLAISEETSVPSVAFVELTLDLYWQNFHDQAPIVHRPTFESGRMAPLVVLVMSAIGCMYIGTEEARRKSELLVTRLDQVFKLTVSHQLCLDLLSADR